MTATRRKPKASSEERKAEVELLVQGINDEAPDFIEFLRKWGDRYGENNLRRLWVQYPRATCLHKFNTWQGMGRQVRTGEKAIWLKTPRTSHDPEKITPDNPTGEVFHGASWVPLFDYAQTDLIGEFTDTGPADASPEDISEVKRLRTEAMKLHPDVTRVSGIEAERAFSAAWDRYETAKKRMEKKQAAYA